MGKPQHGGGSGSGEVLLPWAFRWSTHFPRHSPEVQHDPSELGWIFHKVLFPACYITLMTKTVHGLIKD